jgi:hypothetical protein
MQPVADPKSKSACPSASDSWESSAFGSIFDQEFLLDCFGEDGPEIRTRLLHSILAVRLCQMIHVRLELKLVD